MKYKIKCSDLTGERCDFIAEGQTLDKVKANFYNHGATSQIHKKAYESASEKEIKMFSKKLDAYLKKQG